MRNEIYSEGHLVSYTEIRREDGEVIFDDNGTIRPATDEEKEIFEADEEFQNQPEETKQIPVSALESLNEALNDPSVNSIAEMKNALKEFVNKIV